MSTRACEACGAPAAWHLDHVGRGDGAFWACESCTMEALRFMSAECCDLDGEPGELVDGELRRAS